MIVTHPSYCQSIHCIFTTSRDLMITSYDIISISHENYTDVNCQGFFSLNCSILTWCGGILRIRKLLLTFWIAVIPFWCRSHYFILKTCLWTHIKHSRRSCFKNNTQHYNSKWEFVRFFELRSKSDLLSPRFRKKYLFYYIQLGRQPVAGVCTTKKTVINATC